MSRTFIPKKPPLPVDSRQFPMLNIDTASYSSAVCHLRKIQRDHGKIPAEHSGRNGVFEPTSLGHGY